MSESIVHPSYEDFGDALFSLLVAQVDPEGLGPGCNEVRHVGTTLGIDDSSQEYEFTAKTGSGGETAGMSGLGYTFTFSESIARRVDATAVHRVLTQQVVGGEALAKRLSSFNIERHDLPLAIVSSSSYMLNTFYPGIKSTVTNLVEASDAMGSPVWSLTQMFDPLKQYRRQRGGKLKERSMRQFVDETSLHYTALHITHILKQVELGGLAQKVPMLESIQSLSAPRQCSLRLRLLGVKKDLASRTKAISPRERDFEGGS